MCVEGGWGGGGVVGRRIASAQPPSPLSRTTRTHISSTITPPPLHTHTHFVRREPPALGAGGSITMGFRVACFPNRSLAAAGALSVHQQSVAPPPARTIVNHREIVPVAGASHTFTQTRERAPARTRTETRARTVD